MSNIKQKQKSDKNKQIPTNRNASIPSALISLVNSTLGAGMLGIPLAYAKAGILPALVIHVIMAVMSYYSFHFLIYADDAIQNWSFGDVCLPFEFSNSLIYYRYYFKSTYSFILCVDIINTLWASWCWSR